MINAVRVDQIATYIFLSFEMYWVSCTFWSSKFVLITGKNENTIEFYFLGLNIYF